MTAALPVHPGYPYTADEVLSWPEDGARHEVIDGSLYLSPHANMRHQILVQRLNRLLAVALPSGWEIAAPANVRCSETTLLIPDLIVVDRVDLDALAADPADVRLVVEVVSPSTRRIDRHVKPSLYLDAGIGSVWVIDDLGNGRGPTVHQFQAQADGVMLSTVWPAGAAARFAAPFPVEFDPATLLPEYTSGA